ncbi:MAG: DUF115 domain-containing protein [Candidatus Lokiarchaeota archaeon]|nr:DUF115 domain-containing protein [Candidatus Lokiarchaeota archaeon]
MVQNNIEKLNFYPQFKKWYFKILRAFKFDYQDDIRAAEILSEILNEKSKFWNPLEVFNSFQNYIQSKKMLFIYGCGPSLEKTVIKLRKVLGDNFFSNVINFAADGASVFLRENQIPLDAIFTDLDGISKREFELAQYVVIHAHGDNIDKIIKFKDEILKFKNLIGTVQVNPTNITINLGGFTDGDRILFFLRPLLLPYHKIFLIGMDFNSWVGKYSKPEYKKIQKATSIKRKKLKYALKLLKWLQGLIKNELIFINSNLKSKKFRNISIEEFIKSWS